MKKRAVVLITLILVPLLVIQASRANAATEFKPNFQLGGALEFKADSYFGNYPVIDFRNQAAWGVTDNKESPADNFVLDNPTRPNLEQKIELNFYANPLHDLEIFIKPKYQGTLLWDQLYASYYSDRAMYTLGWFKVEMGALGLLLGNDYSFNALMVNTQLKKTWITALISQLDKVYYNGDSANFPYLASGSDDLLSGRLARKCGQSVIGLNVVADGFDNEKAVSLDFNGRLGKIPLTAEVGAIYPSTLNRDANLDPLTQEPIIKAGYYPGMVISANLVEQTHRMLRLTLGGMTKGFWSLYGTRAQHELEDTVKFGRNLWGGDLLWQQSLKADWILALNLAWMRPIDQEYFDKYQKHVPLATRVVGLKLKKQLSEHSELSVTLKYMGDSFFDYGKLEFMWRKAF